MTGSNDMPLVAWCLQDFNADSGQSDTATEMPPGEDSVVPREIIESNSWTDGYIHAARRTRPADHDRLTKQQVLTALQSFEEKLNDSAEIAATRVTRMLVNVIAAIGHDRWAVGLHDRIQHIRDVIRPALLSTIPEVTYYGGGTETVVPMPWADTGADLTTSCGTISLPDSVTLTWRQGRARSERSPLIQELVSALAPLIFGLPDEKSLTPRDSI